MRADRHNELDERLRADGAHWREATTDQTEAPLALLDGFRDDRHRRPGSLRPRLAIAASIAAVLALAIGVAESRSRPSHHPAGQPTATHPTGSRPTPSHGSGLGPVAPGTHACDASEFRLLGVSHRQTQLGVIITASLKDIGTTTCSIPGHGPLARLLDASGTLIAEGSADADLIGLPPIVVPPSAQIDVQALWRSNCNPPSPATQLHLRLQGRQLGTATPAPAAT